MLGRDLPGTAEWPQAYRLAALLRSITWAEVERVLAGVDRRTPCGKRDYAILLLWPARPGAHCSLCEQAEANRRLGPRPGRPPLRPATVPAGPGVDPAAR